MPLRPSTVAIRTVTRSMIGSGATATFQVLRGAECVTTHINGDGRYFALIRSDEQPEMEAQRRATGDRGKARFRRIGRRRPSDALPES